MIKISYNKQTWSEYDPTKSEADNLSNGATASADRLNHIEDGISNNDINKVTDNKDGTITANGTVFNLLKSLSAPLIPQDPTQDYNTLPQGLAMMTEVNGEPANMPPVKSSYLTLTIASSFAGGRKRQLAWLDAGAGSTNNNFTYIRYCVGSTWSSWETIPTSTQVSSLIYSTIADDTTSSGSTADRPTSKSAGYQYFDTTLNKPIWYTGSAWVDATGATV